MRVSLCADELQFHIDEILFHVEFSLVFCKKILFDNEMAEARPSATK
jgi:hypothetical protein